MDWISHVHRDAAARSDFRLIFIYIQKKWDFQDQFILRLPLSTTQLNSIRNVHRRTHHIRSTHMWRMNVACVSNYGYCSGSNEIVDRTGKRFRIIEFNRITSVWLFFTSIIALCVHTSHTHSHVATHNITLSPSQNWLRLYDALLKSNSSVEHIICGDIERVANSRVSSQLWISHAHSRTRYGVAEMPMRYESIDRFYWMGPQ